MAKQLGVSAEGKVVDLRYHRDNPDPVTKDTTASRFEHRTIRNADGSPLRARRNGKTKTWKTRPNDFQIPCKYGLYEYFYITQDNAHEWCIDN